MNHSPILLGTSLFTASGREASFYPKGIRAADYLTFYADHFRTVEVDATFYACPTDRNVGNWAARTPEGFVFSVKVPQVITHEKVIMDCDADLKQLLDTMDVLGPKLGPIVFQFFSSTGACFEIGTNFSTGSFHSSRSCLMLTSLRLRFATDIGSMLNFCEPPAITRSLSCFRIGR
jgi:Protein of unknown function DUF72